MSHHPLCDEALTLARRIADPAIGTRLTSLLIALAPLESFANETVSNAQMDEESLQHALGNMRVPGGAQ